MASCTRIQNMMQAAVDGELGPSERVIFEHHVATCPACAAALKEQQACCARVFEVFAEHRLRLPLVQPVLEGLPDSCAAAQRDEIVGLNWRAKHPLYRWKQFARLVPGIAVAMLVIVGVILRINWPEPVPPRPEDATGMVTLGSAGAWHQSADQLDRREVRQRAWIAPGEGFETGERAQIVLALAGASEIKVDERSHLRVEDRRRIALTHGRIWVEAGQFGGVFRVDTPAGAVTVLGTKFTVQVAGRSTIVHVGEGQVRVENSQTFALVNEGEWASFTYESPSIEPQRMHEPGQAFAWAQSIGAALDARRFPLAEMFDAPAAPAEVVAAPAFIMFAPTDEPMRLEGILLSWAAQEYNAVLCGYTIYAYDGYGNPLFKCYMDGAILNEVSGAPYFMRVPEHRPVRTISLQFVPDLRPGTAEAEFSKVTGLPRNP